MTVTSRLEVSRTFREKVGFIENTARGHRWGGDIFIVWPGEKKKSSRAGRGKERGMGE